MGRARVVSDSGPFFFQKPGDSQDFWLGAAPAKPYSRAVRNESCQKELEP